MYGKISIHHALTPRYLPIEGCLLKTGIKNENPEGLALPETAYILDEAAVIISKHMSKLMSLGLIEKKKKTDILSVIKADV